MTPTAKHYLGLVALASAFSNGAWAQTDTAYPNRPVRVVVGFTPGSATDITARIFAQRFAESTGVGFTVENIPGAAGTVGAARVVKAPNDGYTLYFGANGAMTIAPSLLSKLPFDPAVDFAPVGLLLTMPSILAVNNDLPAKSLQDLVALARSQPGKLSYASPGVGVPQHIAGELMKIMAKIDMTHVPYKGAVVTDVISGRVAMTFQNTGAILPYLKDNRLRALGVTSLKRSSVVPDLPTFDESGFPGFEAISWFGIFAPNGTPSAITDKLYQESLKVLNHPETRPKFTQMAFDLAGTPGKELGGIIRRDIAKWAKLIKEAGIPVGD
jgi:tripartite-type tricarboxylate transporter receptor subunit TctC